MNKDYKIIECLTVIKHVCKQHFIYGNDYPGCVDCPFFSDRLGECLIREDYPHNWVLNDDKVETWRALL